MGPQLEVHLHTNRTCNLHCKHCYNDSGNGSQDVLPRELVIEIITAFCDRYDVEFHLEGGEIFMYPELLESMNALPDSVLRRITITTNGTFRLESPKALSMLARIGALRISVEGHTDGQQQAVRGISLASVLNVAAYYQRLGVPVVWRATLSSANYDRFVEETIPGLTEQGCRAIQVYEFQQVGRGLSGGWLALGESIGGLLTALETRGAFLDGDVRVMFPRKRIPEVLAHQEALSRKGFCVQTIAPERSISIHADGGVYRCPWDNDKNHCMFNIKEMDLESALKQLERENLTHTCEHCSAIRIVC